MLADGSELRKLSCLVPAQPSRSCGRFLRIFRRMSMFFLKAYFHFLRIKSIFTLDVNNHNG